MSKDNLKDKSDEIRELIIDDYDSAHDSDIDSNVGEQFDSEVRSDLGLCVSDGLLAVSEYTSDIFYDQDYLDDSILQENQVEQEHNEIHEDIDETGVGDGEDFREQAEEGGQGDGGNAEEGEDVREQAEEGGQGDGVNAEGDGEGNDDGSGWREWSKDDVSFEQFIYKNKSGFQPPPGINPKTELNFFQLFFTDNLITEIVNESNRYAAEKIQKNSPLRKKSVWWTWKEITLSEMKAFLGVLINMGLNPKPELDDYFSTDYLDYQPFFKNVFAKERFLQIFWTLHVSPPTSGPVRGTLTRSGKVRRVVSYLDKKFRQYYVPQHEVSVDESTVGFKGRIYFKVYNKDKPIKWGIKIFVLSEANTGYICGLEPYLGRQSTDNMDRQDLGVTSRVVLHLVQKLEQDFDSVEGFHVYTDRFYTNVDLALALHDKKVHLTGTIMRNRKGLPPQVRATKIRKTTTKKQKQTNAKKKKLIEPIKLKKGQIMTFRKDDKLSLVLWKDTNDVTMLTTLDDNSTTNVRRIRKKGVVENVLKPTVVCKYNKSMGGVDLADHYISSYSFIRKSVKWWRKVFFWLFETAIVNSFILFNCNKSPKEKTRQRVFRKQLVKQLVGEIKNVNKRCRPSNEIDDQRLNGKLHMMYPLEERKTKDCSVCSNRSNGGVRKRSKFVCKTCDSNPGLCPGICFEKYHTMDNFKD